MSAAERYLAKLDQAVWVNYRVSAPTYGYRASANAESINGFYSKKARMLPITGFLEDFLVRYSELVAKRRHAAYHDLPHAYTWTVWRTLCNRQPVSTGVCVCEGEKGGEGG